MGNANSSQTASDTNPWFTHGLEFPKFETESRKEGYEVRKYQPSKWVSTKNESMSFERSARTGFRRLFKYITGQNSAGIKIPMTCPVAVKIQPSQGPACESTFTTHFYIPLKHQESTPEPTNKEVNLVEYPEFTAYVLSYSGFNNDEKLLSRAAELGELLEHDGVSNFVKDHYYYAGYDPPYRLFNRHNEIWFISTNDLSD